MSTPKDFSRLDGRPGRKGDRFAEFKKTTDAIIEYREAYHATPAAGRAGLPDPDSDPRTFDPAEALARLRAAGGKVQAVPGVDVKG